MGFKCYLSRYALKPGSKVSYLRESSIDLPLTLNQLHRLDGAAKIHTQINMVHEQNFNAPENFTRTGLRDEMREAGVKNIYSAIDGDMF